MDGWINVLPLTTSQA